MSHTVRNAGFTLVELLMTIALIFAIVGVTIIAINPLRQLGQAEDARRKYNVNLLEKAIIRYQFAYDGFPGDRELPEGQANAASICRGGFAEEGETGCINIDGILEPVRSFIACLPRDGRETHPHRSGYAIYQEAGRAHVVASYMGQVSGGHTCDALAVSIGHWKLDDGTESTVRDSSKNPKPGAPTHMESVGWRRETPRSFQMGNAYSMEFDGWDDSLRWGSAEEVAIRGDLTLAVWAKFDTLTPWWKGQSLPETKDAWEGWCNTLFSLGGHGESVETNHLYWLNVDEAKHLHSFWEAGVGSNVMSVSSAPASAIGPGEWHHYGMVRNTQKKTVHFFVDGKEIGVAQPYTYDPQGGTSSTLWIGDSQTNPENGIYNWNGSMDDIRIYPVALTGGQILSLAKGNP